MAVSLDARSIIPMAHSHAFIVVAIAGLARPMHARARKLLEHCGVQAIEMACAPEPLARLRQKVRLNALVIDARSLEPSEQPVAAFEAMAASGTALSNSGLSMCVIVLGNRHVPAWVRPMCERTGARFFTTRERSSDYPALIRVLRDMCGIEDACCRPLGMINGGEAGR
jgi:hypothetical protein